MNREQANKTARELSSIHGGTYYVLNGDNFGSFKVMASADYGKLARACKRFPPLIYQSFSYTEWNGVERRVRDRRS